MSARVLTGGPPRVQTRAPATHAGRQKAVRCTAALARGSPAGQRVLRFPAKGWDVTYGTQAQLVDISETQAKAFFEPVMPILDPLLLQYFRGDVSVTLGRKYEYLDSRRFAPLVAVASGAGEEDEEGARANRDRFGATGLSFSGRWPANASADARASPTDAARPIMGVVELSIQRDEKEARGRDDHNALAVDLGISDALSVRGAHGVFPAAGVRQPERPDRLTRLRIYRHDMTAGTRHGDQLAVDVAGSRTARRATKGCAIPLPDDLEFVEVISRYFGSWGKSGMSVVATQGIPFDAVLCGNGGSQEQTARNSQNLRE